MLIVSFPLLGSRRGPVSRYSGYGNFSSKDQRPSSLRSKSSRDREDIRFFFKADESPTIPESNGQTQIMANVNSENRRLKSDQHQNDYER